MDAKCVWVVQRLCAHWRPSVCLRLCVGRQPNLYCSVHYWLSDEQLMHKDHQRYLWRCPNTKSHFCTKSKFCNWTNNPQVCTVPVPSCPPACALTPMVPCTGVHAPHVVLTVVLSVYVCQLPVRR
jgi:hypothetical protein